MYAKQYKWTEKGMMSAEIYASSAPAAMPLTTDNIGGVPSGYRLSPGSVLYIVGTGDVYMLGTNNDWIKQ